MRRLVLLLCAASALAAFAACGDDDEAGATTTTDGGIDGTSSLPPADAAPSDAADASSPPREDAAPRVCSTDNFCHVDLPAAEVLRGLWGDGTGIYWAVSDTGDILRYDGTAWKIFVSNPSDSYFAVWGTSATDIWIGGKNGLRHGTGASSAALTFAAVTIPGDVTVPITSIWGASATDIWAVGGDLDTSTGRVVHLTAGTWKDASPAGVTDVAWSTVFGTAGSGVWLGGTSKPGGVITTAAVYRKSASASAFVEVTDDLPPDMLGGIDVNPSRIDVGFATGNLDVQFLGGTALFGLGAQGHDDSWLGTSPDGGTFTWTIDAPAPLPTNVKQSSFLLESSWVRGPKDVWAAGLYGRLRHWDGTTWTQAVISLNDVPETTDLYGVWGNTTSGDLWIVGNQLAIHKAP